MQYSIPCFIMARKSSKGLKNKNRHKFYGLPLIQHTINHAKKSKYVSKILISTDDKKIAEIGNKNHCLVLYPRPDRLSNDNATSLSAVQHAAKYFINKVDDFKIFTYLQITEPLRPIDILDKCIKQLLLNQNLQSSLAGYEYKNNFWIENKKSYKLIIPSKETKKPRQKRKKIFREDCGVALASRKSVLFEKNKLFSKPFKIISYKGVRGLLDIHNKEDIKLGETLIQKFKLKLK